jgi:endonuclease/exonuclease/phosphatase family metal-dependent hydrolase
VRTLTLLDWNCGRREDAWTAAAAFDAEVMLLQEAPPPPAPQLGMPRLVSPAPAGPWAVSGAQAHPWRTAIAVAGHADDLRAEPLPLQALDSASPREVGVSRAGTLAAARVAVAGYEPVQVVSVYVAWENAWTPDGPGWGYPDASAHRVISDVAALVNEHPPRRLLVAGDWNVRRDEPDATWAPRVASVFDRLAALGLVLVGPSTSHGREVPTFRPDDGAPDRQLDYVHASPDLAPHLTVCTGEDRGSDHLPLTIMLRLDGDTAA